MSSAAYIPGVASLLNATLQDVQDGRTVSVTVIAYSSDWTWRTSTAGPVLRVPAVGIAAAHMLARQFERRLIPPPRHDRRV